MPGIAPVDLGAKLPTTPLVGVVSGDRFRGTRSELNLVVRGFSGKALLTSIGFPAGGDPRRAPLNS